MAQIQRLASTARCAAALMLSVVVGIAAGCRETTAAAGAAAIVPEYDPETGRLERISYDRDTDGKPDAWLYMSGTVTERAELDDNYDGVVDRWEHYDSAAPAEAAPAALPRGVLLRAEQATRFDGQISRWERYADGQLVAVEEDTSGDGKADKWEIWSAGSLQSVALDTRGTGTPDRQIVYAADGSAPKLLVDTDGNGSFEPAAKR